MNNVIVNLSTVKYLKGQDRLMQSLILKTDADLRFYQSEEQVGAPWHKDNPYAFKVYAIEKAINEGFDNILWLDASMFVIKDLAPLFEHINKHGYFFQYSGWQNERWTNKEAKEYFGTSDGPMMATGCFGFGNSEMTQYFMRQWRRAMLHGIFKGSHEDHRHDQTCASIIAHLMGLPLSDNNTFWQYGKAEEKPIHENILLIADGIV